MGIPFQLRIGVSGHRTLSSSDQLAAEVRQLIPRLKNLAPTSSDTPLLLTVVSPLAEGADRLVAREVLAHDRATLEAVLPYAQADYEASFGDEASREEFRALLARAAIKTELPATESREESYEQAGQYVVERCDVLIALWDGQPAQGTGGTADIVAWARDRGVPVFWICTASPFTCTEWPGNGFDASAFHALDRFNSASIDDARVSDTLTRTMADLTAHARQAGLDPTGLAPYLSWIMPAYVRADWLASRAQRRFFRVSDATFIFATLAVIASAGPQLLGSDASLLNLVPSSSVRVAPLLESLLMVLGLAAIYLSRRRGYHREWIMYRYLAERLRSAFFLALVTPLEPVAQSPDPTVLHQSGDEWLQRSVDAMWQSRPAIPPSLPVDGLRRFLVAAWVADQRAYQTRKSRGHELAHEQIARTGVLIFAVTLIVAATDALDLGRHGSLWATGAAVVLYLSIILPAVAGAITGIGALREHPRNAHRSDRMARYLARLETRIARAPDVQALQTLVRLGEAMMVEETGDWFVTMELRDVGVTA